MIIPNGDGPPVNTLQTGADGAASRPYHPVSPYAYTTADRTGPPPMPKVPYLFDPTPRLMRELRRRFKLDHRVRRRGKVEAPKPPAIKPVDFEVLRVLLGLRRAYNDSCWCSKRKVAEELVCSERTVQYSLRRLEAAGVIRQVRVAGPGQPDPDEPRNRTGWRIYFLFITARTNLPAGPDRRPSLERKRAQDTCDDPAEVGQVFAPPPEAEVRQDLAPSGGAGSCFESEKDPEPDTSTTTTADPCAQGPADIHAPGESSSSLVSIPLRPEGRACPARGTPAVARPVDTLVLVLLPMLASRVAKMFGLAEGRAGGKVAVAIEDYRRAAAAAGHRFDPGWIVLALDEAERRRAAGKLREWHWGVVLGILANYAREGGPEERASPRSFDPAACLSRLRSLGWTLRRAGPDSVERVKIAGRGAPLWEKLPSDLREQIDAHRAELRAYVLARGGSGDDLC